MNLGISYCTVIYSRSTGISTGSLMRPHDVILASRSYTAMNYRPTSSLPAC